MTQEIKPCPFCGSSNCEEIYQNGRAEGWVVRCNSCGATGAAFAYGRDAVEKWNDVSSAGVGRHTALNKGRIEALAYASGFAKKQLEDGSSGLQPYVYDFAKMLAEEVCESAWQPIETAPKNGAAILANTYVGVAAIFWDDEDDVWCFVSQIDACYTQLKFDLPTHWMPLPSPPKP